MSGTLLELRGTRSRDEDNKDLVPAAAGEVLRGPARCAEHLRMTILVRMTLLSRSESGTRLGARHGQQAFTLRELARCLLSPADPLLLLARFPLGGLLIGPPPLDLAEETFALELLLQDPEGLFNIVVANENFQSELLSRGLCRREVSSAA